MIDTTTDNYLFLRDGTTYTKIQLEEIFYIEADGNYAHVQTENRRFAVKRSLASISDELDHSIFVRASRGIIVNFQLVKTISFANGAITVGDKSVKLGKAYFQDIRERMPRL